MAEKIVNVTPKASARGLREELQREAISRGKQMRSFVGAIYRYATNNRGRFSGAIRSARPKPGDHIGAIVSETVANALESWSTQEQTTRGLWCCYLLEKALEDKMLDQIFGGRRDE